MQLRRIATSLALAVAAFASIATSKAPGWELEATAPIESTVIGTGPATAFAIAAEARGPRNGHDGGDVDVHLDLRAGFENVEGAAVTVTVTSESDPTFREVRQIDVISINQADTVDFFLPAWEACEAGPCFEDFRVEITNATANTSVTVTGEVRALLRGRDQTPEPDSEVLVEVTSLGVVAP